MIINKAINGTCCEADNKLQPPNTENCQIGGILVCIGLQQLSPELAPSHSFGCDVHKIKIVGNGVSQKAVI